MTYFIAVVDHGSISAAARSLFIAQPSLSQAIRSLERSLGVELFDRVGRSVELTQAGQDFAVEARHMLVNIASARAKVDDVRELRSGELDIVTYSQFSIDPLVRLVSEFNRRHRQVVVNIANANGHDGIVAAVRTGDAEIGISSQTGTQRLLHMTQLGEQESVVVLPREIAATVPNPVPRSELSSIPLVLDLSALLGSGFDTDILASGAGNVVVDCERPSMTWDLVRRGVGATILPRRVAEDYLPGMTIRSLNPPLTRTVVMLTRQAQLSPAAAAFIELAQPQSRRG